MVAILKLIISTALLSQVSALAIPKLSELTLQVDEPVLAIDTDFEIAPIEIDEADDSMEKRAAIPVTVSVTSSLPVAVPTGLLSVGEPVLAVRPAGYVKSKATTSRITSSTRSLLPTNLPLVGKLIVGEPVLAFRLNAVIDKVNTVTSTVNI